jgi:hypothetical protein
MKKFLGILVISASLIACDNSASSEQRTKDSTDSARRADSINSALPASPAPVTPSTTDTGTGTGTTGTDTSANKMSTGTDTTQKH